MTASPEGKAKSLSFAVRSNGAEAATKKLNVFAKWQEVCHLSFDQEIFGPSIDGVLSLVTVLITVIYRVHNVP